MFFFIIGYINVVLITIKCYTNRFDNLVKYIFKSIRNLFSKDLIGNFLFLYFADKYTIKEEHSFWRFIEYDNCLSNIVEKIGGKWFFDVDSRCILENESSNISKKMWIMNNLN